MARDRRAVGERVQQLADDRAVRGARPDLARAAAPPCGARARGTASGGGSPRPARARCSSARRGLPGSPSSSRASASSSARASTRADACVRLRGHEPLERPRPRRPARPRASASRAAEVPTTSHGSSATGASVAAARVEVARGSTCSRARIAAIDDRSYGERGAAVAVQGLEVVERAQRLARCAGRGPHARGEVGDHEVELAAAQRRGGRARALEMARRPRPAAGRRTRAARAPVCAHAVCGTVDQPRCAASSTACRPCALLVGRAGDHHVQQREVLSADSGDVVEPAGARERDGPARAPRRRGRAGAPTARPRPSMACTSAWREPSSARRRAGGLGQQRVRGLQRGLEVAFQAGPSRGRPAPSSPGTGGAAAQAAGTCSACARWRLGRPRCRRRRARRTRAPRPARRPARAGPAGAGSSSERTAAASPRT